MFQRKSQRTFRPSLLPVLLLLVVPASALERQPNADYRARRVALSRKTNGGVVVLFAAVEAEGPNALYGFRQDNNFYYLTGLNEPGAALLIAPEIAGRRWASASLHRNPLSAGTQSFAGKVDRAQART